jgi:gluconolactonase
MCDQGQMVDSGRIINVDPQLRTILPEDARLERIADGFGVLEGPVWTPTGDLLFSDMKAHRIYRWNASGYLSLYPAQIPFREEKDRSWVPPGPNGLAFDRQGRLTICEHGNRRVSRVEEDGTMTVLADRYEGKRLNSPNDLVYRSDGLLYFTDPSVGLQGGDADPAKELPFNGLYLLSRDGLRLLTVELPTPNGLAFSPDERYLYVANSGPDPLVMRYAVHPDGTIFNGEVFVQGSSLGHAKWLDGMKVDVQGNLYIASSLGVLIVSPAGRHLGTVIGPRAPTNIAWGGPDMQSLYITSAAGLYRIALNVPGKLFGEREY